MIEFGPTGSNSVDKGWIVVRYPNASHRNFEWVAVCHRRPEKHIKAVALRLLFAIAIGFITASFPAEARHRAGMHRIGILWPVDDERTLNAFWPGLGALGYVEGKNVVLEYRNSRGNDGLLPELAAELVRLDVDLILTWGVTAGQATRQVTTTIPVVNGSMIDPVREKLVESLARPGGNITGLTGEDPDLSAERLQLVSELAPGLSRVAVLATTPPAATVALRETEASARSLGMQLQPVIVQRPDDFDAAFAAMAPERAEALIVLPDLMFDQHRLRLTELAFIHRLPAMYYGTRWIDAGGSCSMD